MTCDTCKHFHAGDCRESPPQVYAFVAPGQKQSIMHGGDMVYEVHVQCAYPHPDVLKPCSKHRAAQEN